MLCRCGFGQNENPVAPVLPLCQRGFDNGGIGFDELANRRCTYDSAPRERNLKSIRKLQRNILPTIVYGHDKWLEHLNKRPPGGNRLSAPIPVFMNGEKTPKKTTKGSS